MTLKPDQFSSDPGKQRRWQMRKKAAQLCTICGKEPLVYAGRCIGCLAKILNPTAKAKSKGKKK